jgi:hypothetical protein
MPQTPALALLALSLNPGLAAADAGKLAGAAGNKPYTITVARVAAQKGQPATAKVVITPAKGWHLNQEFPTSLKLRPPAGVTAKKTDLGKADAALTEQQGQFEVVLTSSEAGRKSVPGDLRFAVCTETTCDPQKSPVVIEMDVK